MCKLCKQKIEELEAKIEEMNDWFCVDEEKRKMKRKEFRKKAWNRIVSFFYDKEME